MRPDILNLEWSSRGRDINIVEPVLSYLEIHHGLRVERDSILNAGWKLLTRRPRLFLISNQGGARINFEAVRLATKMGIPVVSLCSEGVFPDDCETVRRMFWGWNTDFRQYEILHLQWSRRNLELIHRCIPGSSEFNIRVSGATGFDRYKLLDFATKEELLRRKNRSGFDWIVGIAGWTFSHVMGQYYCAHADAVRTILGGYEAVEFHRAVLPRLRAEYRALIENNPDILFILRFHPGETEESLSEFAGLESLPNTLVSRRSDDEIADLISASDLWLAYESTTCLEAWLLGKPTLLLNPMGSDFKRSEIASGSPVVGNAVEAEELIRLNLMTGSLPEFSKLDDVRTDLIRNTIGWDDGRNYVRAGELIMDVFGKQVPKSVDLSALRQVATAVKTQAMLTLGLEDVSSVLRSSHQLRSQFDHAERELIADMYRDAIVGRRRHN